VLPRPSRHVEMVSRAINKLMTSHIVSFYCTFSNDMTRHASTNQIGTFQVARSSRVSDELGTKKSRTCFRRRQVGDVVDKGEFRDKTARKSTTRRQQVMCRVAVMWIGLKQEN